MSRIPHEVAELLAVAAVGVVLRAAVSEAGVRQTEIAEALGVSRVRVYHLLSGQSGNPTIRTLARFANALDMDLVIELRKRKP